MAKGGGKKGAAARAAANRLLADNRLARHQYEILETLETGIELVGNDSFDIAVLTVRDGSSAVNLLDEVLQADPDLPVIVVDAAPDASADALSSSGVSLVAADVIVQYAVADLSLFTLGAVDHEQPLKLVAEREISQYFASHSLDELLGSGRTTAGNALRSSIQARVDEMALGIKVVGVAVTALHPPLGPVSRAFHYQIGAVQQKETEIQKARRTAVERLAQVPGSVELSRAIDAQIRQLDSLRASGNAEQITAIEGQIDALLATARGEAAEIVHEARAYRWARAVGERTSSDRFAGELLAYRAAPIYYRTRRFLEVLAHGLMGRRKFVIAGDPGDTPVFQMDFSDPTSAIDTLLTD